LLVPPIDRAAAIKRLGGNATEYDNLLRMWLQLAPAELQSLAEAIARGDARAVERLAHKLKGMSAFVGAECARQVALRLELMGRAGELHEAPAALVELEGELRRAVGFAGRG
jgi:HPt (histidine-containing phosphotransfer) domain-containing protein